MESGKELILTILFCFLTKVFLFFQWQSASKAINSVESPAKEKHVRSKKFSNELFRIIIQFYSDLILGTFRLEGARLFWSMMTRLQLESHPIVCWKFCYVIHRLLRDGHKHVSYRLINHFLVFDN